MPLFTDRKRQKREARRVFNGFRDLSGSRAIASEFALGALVAELERAKPKAVLELGPGIGTTTKVLLELNPRGLDSSVWCVEENEWCRDQMRINLESEAERLDVVESVLDIPPEAGPFNFVLVDGQGDPSWVDRLAPRASVFVENYRLDQRQAMSARTSRPHVSRSSWPFASLGRLSGYHVIQFEPTRLERGEFKIRGTFNEVTDRLRMLNRRVMARIGLKAVLDWDDRRVYRDRLPPNPLDLEKKAQGRPLDT